MSTQRKTLAALLCGAALLLPACARAVPGNPEAAPNAQPAIQHGQAEPSSVLAPGAQLQFGEGEDAKVCTAGWFLSFNDGSVAMISAGQCADNGQEAVLRYASVNPSGTVSDPVDWEIGKTSTSYKTPYVKGVPNVAVIGVEVEGAAGTRKASPLPGLDTSVKITGEITGEEVEEWARTNEGAKVCWVTDLGTPDSGDPITHCGKLKGGVEDKMVVIADDPGQWKDYHVGAPAMWMKDDGTAVALGIVTDEGWDDGTDGGILIDVLPGDLMEQSGAQIMRQMP